MFLNSQILKVITKRDQSLYSKVLNISLAVFDYSQHLPKDASRPAFRCHSICRAIASFINDLAVIDGDHLGLNAAQRKSGNQSPTMTFEINYVRHTWLVTPDNTIIDPYPVGCFCPNPLMIVCKGIYAPHGSGVYIPNSSTTKVAQTSRLRKETKNMTDFMTKALEVTKIEL